MSSVCINSLQVCESFIVQRCHMNEIKMSRWLTNFCQQLYKYSKTYLIKINTFDQSSGVCVGMNSEIGYTTETKKDRINQSVRGDTVKNKIVLNKVNLGWVLACEVSFDLERKMVIV